MPVNSGDKLAVPVFVESVACQSVVNIKWQQMFAQREALYYVIKAQNITQGNEETIIFVQKEYYSDAENAQNLAKIGETVDGKITFTVDDKFQYGQKDESGTARYIVYHDKERQPYQHRFTEGALTGVTKEDLETWATVPGFDALVGEDLVAFAKNYVGDYLHTF